MFEGYCERGKNITCKELGKVIGTQWLEFNSARIDNVKRVVKETTMKKHWETEGVSLCKGFEQLL